MSYICMVASEKGAVVAGDGRTCRKDTRKNRFRILAENSEKTFIAKGKDTIWATAGIASLDLWNYKKEIQRIMQTGRPLQEKISRYKKRMRRGTWWYHRRMKDIATSALLYAGWEGENLRVGSVTVSNGQIVSEKLYKTPVFVENGSNMHLLTSPKGKYLPKGDASIPWLVMLARRRVREAIQKDKEMAENDPSYKPMVGGQVRYHVLLSKYAKTSR